ncbi:tyrosine phosphatase family protein [Aspergillus saccharolyticus JOP 1030-1]|uniref:diphosphoinositol-polyphosphate diphosphatase n=1 Tax=Aspergillus saccharolyticus JOP 1030-1 TaxID=1450539 RepID=A0A318ZYJ1_9EURO|nr:tyrosine phosphatase [Aspergillus saccharolyticus JOP 1030-1]PYH45168.1 tyrosine phosphatase [Aspergillus saccharolyticus JOP 1030-1]
MTSPLTMQSSNSSLQSVYESVRRRASSMGNDFMQSDLPENFGEVVSGVYRSAFPQPWSFSALRRLGLRTIVTLVDEPYTPEHMSFLKETGIAHIRILVEPNKDPAIKSPDYVICQILEIMLDKANHPVLIHCNKGKHRTGCVIACFRKLQGWRIEDTLAEYQTHSFPKSRPLDQRFIIAFDASPLSSLAQVSEVKMWQSSNHAKALSEENAMDQTSSSNRHLPSLGKIRVT